MSDTARRREEKLAEEVIRRTRGCLPAEELVAYHDGTIQPQNRSTLEAHLPGCPACRAALDYLASEASDEAGEEAGLPAAVSDRLAEKMQALAREEPYLPAGPAAGPAWMKLAAGLFLAVSLAVAGYLWWSPAGFDQDLGELRSNGALQALEPGGVIESVPERFSWSPHPLAVTYAVSLYDAGMNEIWKGRTADASTHLALDAEVREILSKGGKFSWQVFALDRKDWPFEGSAINHFEIAAEPPTR